jgi:hypothetical protein
MKIEGQFHLNLTPPVVIKIEMKGGGTSGKPRKVRLTGIDGSQRTYGHGELVTHEEEKDGVTTYKIDFQNFVPCPWEDEVPT